MRSSTGKAHECLFFEELGHLSAIHVNSLHLRSMGAEKYPGHRTSSWPCDVECTLASVYCKRRRDAVFDMRAQNLGRDKLLKFPEFRPNQYERDWVLGELQTARVIRMLWTNTAARDRSDPNFLAVLTRFSWINQAESDGESTRLWRNRHLAAWVDSSAEGSELARALSSRTRLSLTEARRIIGTSTGISHYYTALRPGALRAIRRHTGTIHSALEQVAQKSPDAVKKVGEVAAAIVALPPFRGPAGRSGSLLNALTPLVACLDPQRRFPIMNHRTERLLRALGRTHDVNGAMALAGLIGQHNLRHSFALDVYAASGRRKFPPAQRKTHIHAQRPVGRKDEEEGYARLSKKRIRVRRLHNALVNRFVRAVEWKYRLLESEFDVVLDKWRGNRKLLVEAKTATNGPAGRTQLRQAIGQLHDYRWRAFPDKASKVDLALLVPNRPEDEVISLLRSVGIEALWFDRTVLKGTVPL